MKTLNRNFLLTTPRGLVALHKAHPAVTVTVASGLQSTDCAFLDAHLAHQLHGWMAVLARAANEVVLDCQPRQVGRKNKAKVEAATPRSLATLASALKAAQAGYSAIPTRARKGSSQVAGLSRLSSTTEGLRALRKSHPSAAIQGADGFISSETMYRDAAMAHGLETALLGLFRAAATVYQECHCQNRKPSPTALAALETSLAPAREWNWEVARQGQPRGGGSGKLLKRHPRPEGNTPEALPLHRGPDRSAA